MKKKVYFRADAGQSIGYGHFIRSLALADMLKDDFDCTFFTQSPTEYQKQEAGKVCPLVALPADDTKFGLFLEQLKGDEIVVLDNYFFTSEYQLQIKQRGCKLVCIDDMHDKHYCADAVINHGFASVDQYDKESDTKLFLGPEYALLRSPFLQKTDVTKRDSGHWVICFGGVDTYNITTEVARILSENGNVDKITAIVGDGFLYKNELKSIPKVFIESKLSAQEMSSIYTSAYAVVCSASSVCYEALACGCKVYAGYYVDNQYEFYNHLSGHKYIIPLGNLLQNSFYGAFDKSDDVKTIAFGKIKTNIRAVFYALAFDIINYTDLTEEQSYKVWEVRNLPEIRECMRNTATFSYDGHKTFIEKLKKDSTKLYLAFFINNELVGSYDFIEIGIDSSAERGLFINPKYQGKGMAPVIERIMDIEAKKHNVRYLMAEVLKTNVRSINYHKKIGYSVQSEDEKFIFLKRTIH